MAGTAHLRPTRLVPPLVGVLLLGAGAVASAGWHWSRPAWAALGISEDPISRASALGFVLCGLGLLAASLNSRRIPFYLGGGLALLSLALFSRYAAELFLEVHLDVPPPAPGIARELLAIPPNSALAFALAGLALTLSRRSAAIQGLIGALVLTLGSVAVLGHITGATSAFTWGAYDEMGFPTALGLGLFGAALVARSLALPGSSPRAAWRPLAAGIATILAGLLFWYTLRAQELETFHRNTEAMAEVLGGALEDRLELIMHWGERWASLGEAREWTEPPIWKEQGELVLGFLPGFREVLILDPPTRDERVADEEPVDSMPSEIGTAPAAPAPIDGSAEAVDRRIARIRAAALELVDGRPSLAVIGPLPAPDRDEVGLLVPVQVPGLQGLFLATFDVREVMAPLARPAARGYSVEITCRGRPVYRRLFEDRAGERWSRRFDVDTVGEVPWQVRLEPTSRWLAAQRTGLPELALGAGVLVAVLLTLTLRLGEVETRRARAFEEEVRRRTAKLEDALASLKAQNRQRQRSEERLRRSQEVARLLSAELDHEVLAQGVTEAATELTGASFGVFLYQVLDQHGAPLSGCAFSGVGLEALGPLAEPGPAWPHPLQLVEGHALRFVDVSDMSWGQSGVTEALPFTHLPVRSYLAVPVRSRSGELYGGLYFGHAEAAVFTEREEEVAESLAAQTAVAMENARLYQAERRARAAAQSASATKDRFLATLGHELRNPLGSISTALEVLSLQPRDAAKERRMLDIVARQVRQLARLVDDLLDLSKIERGKISVRPQRLDLVPLVRETTESHRPELESAGLHFALELPSEPVWVDADSTRLAQVLSNLLGNAAKFTDAGGEVTVALEPRGTDVVVSVKDTGCGMAPEELAQVFEPFAQSQAASSRLAGGLGLGLTIARSLVEVHGGTIEAVSDGPGKGTELSFTLPRRTARDRPRPAASPPVDAPSLRVLVVDDHHDAAHGLAELLTLLGNEARVAHDGEAGLEVVRSWLPDLIISDLGMPGMDGFELAGRLSNEGLAPRPWLCALSGFGDEGSVRRALEAGFDQHLIKPVDMARLQEVLAGARGREAARPGEASLEHDRQAHPPQR
jgi:signal transduction histidine kinase/CheY-like chemotaxis protein